MSRNEEGKARAAGIAERTLEDVHSWPRERLLALASEAARTRVEVDGATFDVVVDGYPEGEQEGYMRVVVAVNEAGSLLSAMSPQSCFEVLPIPDGTAR